MSYDNLVIALAVAAAVPFLLALAPRVRLPGPVLEIVVGPVLGKRSWTGCGRTGRSRRCPSSG